MYKRRKTNAGQTPSTQVTPVAAISRLSHRSRTAYQAYSDGSVARPGTQRAWKPDLAQFRATGDVRDFESGFGGKDQDIDVFGESAVRRDALKVFVPGPATPNYSASYYPRGTFQQPAVFQPMQQEHYQPALESRSHQQSYQPLSLAVPHGETFRYNAPMFPRMDTFPSMPPTTLPAMPALPTLPHMHYSHVQPLPPIQELLYEPVQQPIQQVGAEAMTEKHVILANKAFKHVSWLAEVAPRWIEPTPLLPADVHIRSQSICIFFEYDHSKVSEAKKRFKHVVVCRQSANCAADVVQIPTNDVAVLLSALVSKRESDVGAWYATMDEEFCDVVSANELLKVAAKNCDALMGFGCLERLVFASEAEVASRLRDGMRAREFVQFWNAEQDA